MYQGVRAKRDKKLTKIIVDQRELRSPVAREMDKLNIDMQFEILPVADYILSERCAVERKTVDDFYNSLFTDKKLFGQLHDLKQYDVPILIIEGYEGELYTARNIDARVVDGILNIIALMRIPIRFSINPAGTARILVNMATHEQTDNKKTFSYHGKRSSLSPKEQLTYTLSSVTDIGTTKANNLLSHFKSLKAVVNADIEQLIEVDLIGKPTAKHIKEYFEREFK